MSLISTQRKTGLNEIFEGGESSLAPKMRFKAKITPKNGFFLLIKLKLAKPVPLF